MKNRAIAVLYAMALMVSGAQGSGMLIPKDKSLPPLAIKHQRVDIRLRDGVATSRIDQSFKNHTNRDLEAVYVFPLPENAGISDFGMWIGGKRVSGELVEKDKAGKIYRDIVRRMKDPGLLEHLGGKLFRVSVYPVPKNGEQRIEIEYSQVLEFEGGLYKYIYPLKTEEKASQTLEDFTISVRVASSVPIRNVYSPSHEVGITRKGDFEATIGFEKEQALLDRDFVLYYGVSKKAFGLNLLTHAVKGKDGTFMMLLAPATTLPKDEIVRKDVTFVLDTSGSMLGEKMEQAKRALMYCVKKLNDGDRFNVVQFSTDVDSLGMKLLDVNDKNRKEALEFIEELEARGGTDINGALLRACSMYADAKRPGVIVFLTDGKPTIGETDLEKIIGNITKANAQDARMFVFGVGENVNTHLLDKISGKHGGYSTYVEPKQDIEVKVSSFSDKMSKPVLARPRVTVDKVKIEKMHPRELPDLFHGEQLVLFGRYTGDGHVAIRLTGEVNGEKREFVYEGTFQETNADNTFIPRLWATRRVGYLLDEIRLHGEEAELREEVIRLSKEYGIMTPYTSYLVLESDEAYRQHGIPRDGGSLVKSGLEMPARPQPVEELRLGWSAPKRKRAAVPATDAPMPATVPVFSREAGEADALTIKGGAGARYRLDPRTAGDISRDFKEDSGLRAIRFSEAIDKYKHESKARDDVANVRHVGDRIFFLVGGVWIDSEYKEEMNTRKVAFAGDEYFKLLDDKPELKKFLALGRKVIVVLQDGTALVVE